jgi:hypothetical protein
VILLLADFLSLAWRLARDGRQKVLNHIVLPIADLPFSLDFGFLVVGILDVEPSVVLEVAEDNLIELLGEELISSLLVSLFHGWPWRRRILSQVLLLYILRHIQLSWHLMCTILSRVDRVACRGDLRNTLNYIKWR